MLGSGAFVRTGANPPIIKLITANARLSCFTETAAESAIINAVKLNATVG